LPNLLFDAGVDVKEELVYLLFLLVRKRQTTLL
jgi:hypothetical protein